jgi:hypothetical protein
VDLASYAEMEFNFSAQGRLSNTLDIQCRAKFKQKPTSDTKFTFLSLNVT